MINKVKSNLSLLLSFLIDRKSFLIILFIGAGLSYSLQAQTDKNWKVSGSVAYGHAPTMTFKGLESSGSLLIFSGDLEYKRIIGRLQYTSLLQQSFEDRFNNLRQGNAFHGALGYNVPIIEKIDIPIMLSGGAALISYNTGIFGSGGDNFVEGSPQIGVTIAPCYYLTRQIAVQGMFRFHKGFEADRDHEPIDLTDLSIGLKLTI